MKNLHSLFICMAITGCTSTTVKELPHPRSARVLDIGQTTEAHLTKRYNDISVNCGDLSRPAFLCNGVLIRGTNYSPNRHSWDNSPNNHASGGVSFSYLRRDSKYKRLAYDYDNGYIFEPILYAGDKISPEVLCSFPLDSSTSGRSDKGCGVHVQSPGSGACQSQGIDTATAWYNHFRAGGNSRTHQCGFNVKDSLNDGAAPAFDATIKSMALISADSFSTQNEVRIAVWPDGSGNVLPLEAFFYINSIPAGRADAQNDQRDFKNMTGISLPVISLWLPKTPGEQASFRYLPTDQVVPMP